MQCLYSNWLRLRSKSKLLWSRRRQYYCYYWLLISSNAVDHSAPAHQLHVALLLQVVQAAANQHLAHAHAHQLVLHRACRVLKRNPQVALIRLLEMCFHAQRLYSPCQKAVIWVAVWSRLATGRAFGRSLGSISMIKPQTHACTEREPALSWAWAASAISRPSHTTQQSAAYLELPLADRAANGNAPPDLGLYCMQLCPLLFCESLHATGVADQ